MTNAGKSHARPYRARYRAIFLLLWLPILVVPTHGSQSELDYWPYKYPPIRLVGLQAIRLKDDTCVAFFALMHAGKFFEGLERVTTSEGVKFRKGSISMEYFPKEVFLWVEAAEVTEAQLGRPCSEITSEPGLQIPSNAQDLIKALRFKAEWKRGFKLRPVESLSVELTRPNWPEWEWTDFWLYILTVRAEDVPLTDHLIVSLLFEGRKQIARFSARL